VDGSTYTAHSCRPPDLNSELARSRRLVCVLAWLGSGSAPSVTWPTGCEACAGRPHTTSDSVYIPRGASALYYGVVRPVCTEAASSAKWNVEFWCASTSESRTRTTANSRGMNRLLLKTAHHPPLSPSPSRTGKAVGQVRTMGQDKKQRGKGAREKGTHT
jgi:hypothetical protein